MGDSLYQQLSQRISKQSTERPQPQHMFLKKRKGWRCSVGKGTWCTIMRTWVWIPKIHTEAGHTHSNEAGTTVLLQKDGRWRGTPEPCVPAGLEHVEVKHEMLLSQTKWKRRAGWRCLLRTSHVATSARTHTHQQLPHPPPITSTTTNKAPKISTNKIQTMILSPEASTVCWESHKHSNLQLQLLHRTESLRQA